MGGRKMAEDELLVTALLAGLIGSLIGAVLLRAAAKWVARLDVPFGKAYWTVYIAYICNFALAHLLGSAVAYDTNSIGAVNVLQVIVLPVGFLIQSGIISSRLELSFGKGCLISITMIGIALAIVLAAVLVIVLIMLIAGLSS
jgi:hypothetical protein